MEVDKSKREEKQETSVMERQNTLRMHSVKIACCLFHLCGSKVTHQVTEGSHLTRHRAEGGDFACICV